MLHDLHGHTPTASLSKCYFSYSSAVQQLTRFQLSTQCVARGPSVTAELLVSFFGGLIAIPLSQT